MIIVFEQDLTHYRASFYDFLASQIEEEILILYGHGEPNSSHIFVQDDSLRNFKTKEISRTWLGKSLYYQSLKEIKEIIERNTITCIVHRGAIRNIGLLRELLYFKRKGIPTILRGIGYSVRREFNPRFNIIDRLHKKIIDTADAYLCYTSGSKKILDNFYNPKKIIVAVNTLNSDLLTSHFNELERVGKENVKNELKLDKEQYLIHVGRLSTRKKIDRLISIYGQVKNKTESIGLILVGDGPHRVDLEKKVSELGLSDVIFTGAMSSESIVTSKYLFCSDVVVIPGNLGLTVNHAFLFGKPVVGHVISAGTKPPKNYIHGPEHEYLIDELNGLIVRNESFESFTEAIIRVLNNSEFGENALKFARENLTVQKMAGGYIDAIEYVTKMKLRRKK